MQDLSKPPLDELAHHGVKGMKWGQRKAVAGVSAVAGGTTAGAKKVGRGAKKVGIGAANLHWEGTALSSKNAKDVKIEAYSNMTVSMVSLKRSPKYKGKNLRKDADLRSQYFKEAADRAKKATDDAVRKKLGSNYSNTREARFNNDMTDPKIEIREKVASHSDDPSLDFDVNLVLDSSGFIISTSMADDFISQGEDWINGTLTHSNRINKGSAKIRNLVAMHATFKLTDIRRQPKNYGK